MQFRSSASHLVVLVLASVLACSVARPGRRSPCQDGSRPSCADGTVIQRPARGDPPPTCNDGTTPLCDDGSEPQRPQGGHSGSSEEGGRPHRSPCQDGSRPSCADGTVIQRPRRGDPPPTCNDGTTPLCEDGSEPQRPPRRSPCQDGSRPSCADGTTSMALLAQLGGDRDSLPTCNDGTTPLCEDGSEPQRPPRRSPCQDGSRPSCADGTVIQRPARGDPPPTCNDGTTPLCEDGSEPQRPPRRSPCDDRSRPSCADGTTLMELMAQFGGDSLPTCNDGTTPLCEDGSEPQRPPRHSSEEEEDSLVKGRFGGWGKPEGQGHGRPGGHKKPKHGPKPSLCYLSINDNVTIDQPCAFDGELFECVEPKRHHLKPHPDSNEGMFDGMFDGMFEDMSSWSDLFDGMSVMFQDIFGSDEDEDMSRHAGGRRPWWKSSEEEDDEDMEHHKKNITVKVCVPLNCTADSDCSGDNMCLAGKPHKRGQWQSQGQWQWGGQGGQWSDSDSNEERPDKRHGGRCEITCAQKVYASACLLTDAADAVVRNATCPPFLTCNTEHGRVFTYQGETLTAHHCQKAGETRFPMFHECAGVKPPRNNTTSDD